MDLRTFVDLIQKKKKFYGIKYFDFFGNDESFGKQMEKSKNKPRKIHS